MDRAYEGDKTRLLAINREYIPVVPPKRNRKSPWEYNRELYKRRNTVERFFLRIKRFRKIFIRYDKLDVIFSGFILFACELADFSRRYGVDFDKFYFDVQKAIATLSSYLQQDEDEISEEQEKNMNAKLHLMTALRTKGKEYDSVFILATNETIWPIRFAKTEEQLEAERRLFYVAVTRARRELCFMVYRGMEESPYLKELGLDV